MRLGAPDLFGAGRSVNAVARLIQPNPSDTDRIVWAGRQDELAINLAAFRGFGKYFRVEGVIRVRNNSLHVELADGPLVDALGDAAREMCQQHTLGIERTKPAIVKVDYYACGLDRRDRAGHRGNPDYCAGAEGAPIDTRVKAAQEDWV